MLERGEAQPAVRERAAALVRSLAFGVAGVALPVAMVAANKSAPASFTLATLMAVATAILEGRWPDVVRRHGALLRTPVAGAVLAFAAVCLLSLFWSIDRAWSVRALAQTLLMAYVGLWAAATFPLIRRSTDAWLLVGGLGLAALLAIFDASFGMRLHGWLGERLATFDLKRSCIVLTILFWPALAFARQRPGGPVALLPAVPLAVAIKLVSAATSGLGLAVGLVVYAAGRLAPRFAAVAVAVCVAALLLLAPVSGRIGAAISPTHGIPLFAGSHALERVEIWAAFEARFFDRPWLGYGFDTSARVSTAPRPASAVADPAADSVIATLHPHNGLLQIWVELGTAGALAAALVFGTVLLRLARVPPGRQAERLALFASAVVMALVGFGLWQAWWSASVASSIVWMLVVDRDGMERRDG